MKRTLRYCTGILLSGAMLLGGCRASDDAAAASKQLTTTATDLKAYYSTLADTETDLIALFELDASLGGPSFGAADRKTIEDTRDSLEKRADMADAMVNVATSFDALVTSKAPGDAETAATALSNELITLKAISSSSPVPPVVAKAGNYLLQIVQHHDEKKAAEAMDQTMAAITQLFFVEKNTYDSITRAHLEEAGVLAKHLINKGQVDPTGMLEPALKPFDLTPLPADATTQTNLKALALTRLDDSEKRATKKAMDASSAMLDCLKEMSARIHLLATGQRMTDRGNPSPLKIVESWLALFS